MKQPAPTVAVIARYVLLGAAIGVPVGLLWVWLSPPVLVRSVADASFVEAYPQGFASADLTLGTLLLVVGLGLGVVALIRLRRCSFVGGTGQVFGLISGGLMCAAVARVLGWWLAGRSVAVTPDGLYELPLRIGAPGVLLLAAFSGLLVVLFGALWFADQD